MPTPPILERETALPPLREGDRLDQKTFHARYEAMPGKTRAELVGGVVYMPSPLLLAHGDIHGEAITWLKVYKSRTPGTMVADNATAILGDDSEPQPDISLIILPERGGQARVNADGYLEGGPELVVEVALSSEAFDLGEKRRDYEAHGVREYVVVLLRRQEVVWFVRGDAGFVPLPPEADGIFRSPLFGGLWLDPQALLQADTARILEVLYQGLASPAHAAFVERGGRET